MTYEVAGGSCMIFVSSEPLLLGDAKRDIVTSSKGKVDPVMDQSQFRGGQHSAQEILDSLSAYPFSSEFRLVLVDEAESIAAADQRDLAQYFKDPSPQHALFLFAKKLDGRGALSATAKKQKMLTALNTPQKPGEFMAFAKTELKKLGKTAENSAVALLVDWTAGDLMRLRGELEKLDIFVPGERITADHVREAVARSHQSQVFDFIDAFAERKIGRCLIELKALMSDGEPPLRILALMVRQTRLLHKASELIAQGEGGSLEKELGVHPFVARKIRGQVRNGDPAEYARWFHVMVDTDKKIKSGKMSPDFALEDAVYRVIRPEWA